MTNKDRWTVRCPKCGPVRESCRHVSKEDVRRIVRLLQSGVEVYENEDAPHGGEHVHDPPSRGRLYQVVRPRFSLKDVVLSARTRQGIEDGLAEIRHKALIFDRWGLQRVVRRRKGLSMLFAGPPGTGKTMAAEAIARSLRRSLMIVNYAQLENMWVGETEKNIESVFQAAGEEEAILFFDEADAVFHRRGFATAPWTNRDVNVLLHHLENFPGIVILATNMGRVMDRALDRRIDIAVEFEMPNAAQRLEILKRTVPEEAPLAKDVDLAELARRYPLSGGSILNVVRQAMRNSLRRGRRHKITMDDFRQAAEAELRKSEVVTRDHLGTWQVEPRQRVHGYV